MRWVRTCSVKIEINRSCYATFLTLMRTIYIFISITFQFSTILELICLEFDRWQSNNSGTSGPSSKSTHFPLICELLWTTDSTYFCSLVICHFLPECRLKKCYDFLSLFRIGRTCLHRLHMEAHGCITALTSIDVTILLSLDCDSDDWWWKGVPLPSFNRSKTCDSCF